MAFTMEQGVNPSLSADHDTFKKSFATGHSSLLKDAGVQASECFVGTTGLEPSNKLRPSSPFSLGMSYEQEQETHDGSGASGGTSTPDVAPCTPCPPFLQQRPHGQKLTKTTHAFPSLCLGIGLLEGQQVPCIQRLRKLEKPSSSKELLKQLSAGSPESFLITPMQGYETRLEGQKTPETFKGALFASKVSKPEQYWQESHEPHSMLSLSNLTETSARDESPANLRSPRFSFVEALTGRDSQLAQETGFTRHNESCASAGIGCLQPLAGRSNNFESILSKFYDSSNTSEKALPVESFQQADTSVFVSNVDKILMNSQSCFLNANTSSPFVKQDWSRTFKRFPHLYQALSQTKDVPVSASDVRKSPEKRRRLLSAQENHASGASDMCMELNGSLSNADQHRTQNFEQLSVRKAQEVTSSRKTIDWDVQSPDNFFRPVSLAKVKVENDYEDSYGGRYTHGDSVEEDDGTGGRTVKAPWEMGFLGSSCAGMSEPPMGCSMDMAEDLQQSGPSNISVCVRLPQVLSTVSAGGLSVRLYDEPSQKQMNSGEHTPPTNRKSQTNGCWGKFLALSASGDPQQQMVKGDNAEIVLPFQRRFKQLQEFLKQCDTSDKYSLQAFRSVSAAALNGSAVELETRAVRLSLIEGKELKRMKQLNVLGNFSEGVPTSSAGAVYGTRLPMPVNNVQVKQEL